MFTTIQSCLSYYKIILKNHVEHSSHAFDKNIHLSPFLKFKSLTIWYYAQLLHRLSDRELIIEPGYILYLVKNFVKKIQTSSALATFIQSWLLFLLWFHDFITIITILVIILINNNTKTKQIEIMHPTLL